MGFHYPDAASQWRPSRTLSAKAPNSPSFEMKCPSNEDSIDVFGGSGIYVLSRVERCKPPDECAVQARMRDS